MILQGSQQQQQQQQQQGGLLWVVMLALQLAQLRELHQQCLQQQQVQHPVLQRLQSQS
jgi:hypothetical protein